MYFRLLANYLLILDSRITRVEHIYIRGYGIQSTVLFTTSKSG